jgi:hypothetical protein
MSAPTALQESHDLSRNKAVAENTHGNNLDAGKGVDFSIV